MNTESIKKAEEHLKEKYPIQQFKAHEKILNTTLKFGLNIQKYVDEQENKFMQFNNLQGKEQKTDTQEFAQKVNKLSEIVDFLLHKTA